jgi:hypothetical protein
LCLGADAVGKIIQPIVGQIKYRVAHASPVSTAVCYAAGAGPGAASAVVRASVLSYAGAGHEGTCGGHIGTG